MAHVDQREVGLAARRQASEVGPAQHLGAADRGRLESVPRRAHLVVHGDGAGEVADQPHLIEHVVREGVGADADRDARIHVASDRVHHHAAPREDGRAVRDRGAGVAQPLEVVGVRVVDLRMVVQEDAMADDEVGPQHADRVEPFDGRLAVAMDHLVELDDGLAGMGLHRQAAPSGLLQRLLEEALAAGVDLRGADHAGEAAARMLRGLVERCHRGLESLLAGLLIPGILNGVAVLGVPDALPHHRTDDGADAG